MDFLHKLHDALASHGIYINETIRLDSDRFQRFKNANVSRGGRDIFIRLLGYKGAIFGDWHDKDNYVVWWYESYNKINREEKLKRKQEIEKTKREILALRKTALLHLQSFLPKCTATNFYHPYIKKKQITPYGAREFRGLIVLPIKDLHGNLISAQFIKPDGFKQFARNTSPKGGSLLIGDFSTKIIHICEGWATGCTLYEALKEPVLCAFNANNLINVAENVRILYPKIVIFIMADNDCHGRDNTGLKCAIEAGARAKGLVIYPEFNRSEGAPTDWNDLHVMAGIDAVRSQVKEKKASLFHEALNEALNEPKRT